MMEDASGAEEEPPCTPAHSVSTRWSEVHTELGELECFRHDEDFAAAKWRGLILGLRARQCEGDGEAGWCNEILSGLCVLSLEERIPLRWQGFALRCGELSVERGLEEPADLGWKPNPRFLVRAPRQPITSRSQRAQLAQLRSLIPDVRPFSAAQQASPRKRGNGSEGFEGKFPFGPSGSSSSSSRPFAPRKRLTEKVPPNPNADLRATFKAPKAVQSRPVTSSSSSSVASARGTSPMGSAFTNDVPSMSPPGSSVILDGDRELLRPSRAVSGAASAPAPMSPCFVETRPLVKHHTDPACQSVPEETQDTSVAAVQEAGTPTWQRAATGVQRSKPPQHSQSVCTRAPSAGGLPTGSLSREQVPSQSTQWPTVRTSSPDTTLKTVPQAASLPHSFCPQSPRSPTSTQTPGTLSSCASFTDTSQPVLPKHGVVAWNPMARIPSLEGNWTFHAVPDTSPRQSPAREVPMVRVPSFTDGRVSLRSLPTPVRSRSLAGEPQAPSSVCLRRPGPPSSPFASPRLPTSGSLSNTAVPSPSMDTRQLLIQEFSAPSVRAITTEPRSQWTKDEVKPYPYSADGQQFCCSEERPASPIQRQVTARQGLAASPPPQVDAVSHVRLSKTPPPQRQARSDLFQHSEAHRRSIRQTPPSPKHQQRAAAASPDQTQTDLPNSPRSHSLVGRSTLSHLPEASVHGSRWGARVDTQERSWTTSIDHRHPTVVAVDPHSRLQAVASQPSYPLRSRPTSPQAVDSSTHQKGQAHRCSPCRSRPSTSPSRCGPRTPVAQLEFEEHALQRLMTLMTPRARKSSQAWSPPPRHRAGSPRPLTSRHGAATVPTQRFSSEPTQMFWPNPLMPLQISRVVSESPETAELVGGEALPFDMPRTNTPLRNRRR